MGSEDESFTDVIERLLDREREFEAGFGAWAETGASRVGRETRAETNETIAGSAGDDGRVEE